LPRGSTIAFLTNWVEQFSAEAADVQATARQIGLQIGMVEAGNERELDAPFASLAQTRPDVLPRCSKSVFPCARRSYRRGSMEHVRGIFGDPENLEYGAFRAKRDPRRP